jgi:glucose-1-phosphate adenylyltransferase
MKNVVAVILAGGKGSRLEPLTRDRAKPAVPFGGIWRIIDFALSNCLNSGIRKMLVLTQYKARSLDRHINRGWRKYFCSELGEFVDIVPPQQRIDEQWYQGTADAVYQNIYSLEKESSQYVVILAGDHIYKMDYGSMLSQHIEQGADLTIAALPVSPAAATQFGVMQVNAGNRITGFEEKPERPKTLPDNDQLCLASMGIYIFTTRVLFELLCRDANLPHSSHDFGRDIIPSMIDTHCVVAYPFRCINNKPLAYWRDVGTLDAYYQANMDLVSVEPQLNVYDQTWPIRTFQPNLPPPKFVFGSQPHGTAAAGVESNRGEDARIGCALDSIVCPGTIISGALVQRSVVGCGVRIQEHAQVSDSILLDGVTVGPHSRIRRAIIDKDVQIPGNVEIGWDPVGDGKRGFTVTRNGVIVIAKGDRVREDGTASPSPLRRWHVRNKVLHDQ